MNPQRHFAKGTIAVSMTLAATALLAPAMADDNTRSLDFGAKVERLLHAESEKLFGVKRPITASAPATAGAYRTETQTADDQVKLAQGLRVSFLTREAADKTDMLAFWPSDEQATHLISCVEGGREIIGMRDGMERYNPSVQRIDLGTGSVETVLRGMDRCDGIRTTPWGTILATEEEDDGGAYEILDPLAITDAAVINRTTGEVSDPDRIAKRAALPTMAWEGLTVLASGVVIAGDELRPGSGSADKDGGAIFKFVPAVPWDGGPVITLEDSPLVWGNSYAMQISCRDGRQQFGQGCEVGNAGWIPVDPLFGSMEITVISLPGIRIKSVTSPRSI